MTLTDYGKVIRKRWILIAIIIVCSCVAAGYAGSRFSLPSYEAKSQLIVNKTTLAEDGNFLIQQADLAVNIMLINTYKELIKTPPILQLVVKQNPDLRLTVSELTEKLKVTTSPGSQIMTVVFSDPSYGRASKTVNAVMSVFIHESPGIMKVENAGILSQADPSNAPVPKQTGLVLIVLIALIASSFIAVPLAFLLEYFDDSAGEAAVLEKMIGLTVITEIPVIRRSDLKHLKQAASYKRVGEESHVHVNG
jgi:capsular polysaccharide biosynthesis protein